MKKSKPKKFKYSLWEKLDFITGKKFVVCNHPDDIKMLKSYFPIGTKIVSKASGPRGAYYVMDMEAIKRMSRSMAKDFVIPKPEPEKWNKGPKLLDGKIYLNTVVKYKK